MKNIKTRTEKVTQRRSTLQSTHRTGPENFVFGFEEDSLLKYIIRQGSIAFLMKLPLGILGYFVIFILGLTAQLYSATNQIPILVPDEVFLGIAIAPLLETFIGQMIPITLGKYMTTNKWLLVLLSSTLFMILHYPVIEFFPSAFGVGVILAGTWIHYSSKFSENNPIRHAFIATTLVHAFHNTLAVFFTAVFGG